MSLFAVMNYVLLCILPHNSVLFSSFFFSFFEEQNMREDFILTICFGHRTKSQYCSDCRNVIYMYLCWWPNKIFQKIVNARLFGLSENQDKELTWSWWARCKYVEFKSHMFKHLQSVKTENLAPTLSIMVSIQVE